MINRIVTRGFGPSRGVSGRAGLVTHGYGGFRQAVAQFVEQIKVKIGGSRQSFEKNVGEIVVRAKLVYVNQKKIFGIEGTVRVFLNRTVAGSIKLIENVERRIGQLISVIIARKNDK